MEAGTGRRHRSKWRKFKRKYGATILICVAVFLIVALTGAIMFILTSPNYRIRWSTHPF